MNVLQQRLLQFFSNHAAIQHYCLGFSGGIDSTVLLHSLSSLKSQLNSSVQFRAIHINHGLQDAADQWSIHCQKICNDVGIDYELRQIDVDTSQGESPEAAARDARYRTFKALLKCDECLLTAQHQNDQAETLLLQLLRGGGPAGLASMPEMIRFAEGWLARPLLQISRVEIEIYAAQYHLSWVEDKSNQDLAYSRNYLRHRVSPALAEHWPAYAKTLQRASRLQAEASEILQDVAEIDLKNCQQDNAVLSIEKILSLSVARCKNVVRYWLQQCGFRVPSEAQLDQIILACSAGADSSPCISWQGAEVRRHKQCLYALSPQNQQQEQFEWDLSQPFNVPAISLTLSRDDLIQAGLKLPDDQQMLQVRYRQGGESIRLPGRRHSHKVKKLLQELEIPLWQRRHLPMFFDDNELIAIFGLQPPIIASGWRRGGGD